jgi:hypothetical protein
MGMGTKHPVAQFGHLKGSTEGSCKDCPINQLPAPGGGSTSIGTKNDATKTYSVKQYGKK